MISVTIMAVLGVIMIGCLTFLIICHSINDKKQDKLWKNVLISLEKLK